MSGPFYDDIAVFAPSDEEELHVEVENCENGADEEGGDECADIGTETATVAEEEGQAHEGEGLTTIERQYAKQHYEKYMALCSCNETYGRTCKTEERLVFAMEFAAMEQTRRTNTVRAILFALTAPNIMTNEVLRSFQQQTRKRRKLSNCPNTSTVYLISGQRVCQSAFCAIVQLARATINRIGTQVAKEGYVEKKSKLHESRKGKVSMQTAICVRFLRGYGRRFGMACPTGRGSKFDEPVRYIDRDVTNIDVYKQYCQDWSSMVQHVCTEQMWSQQEPTEPLVFRSFLKVWRQKYPTLRMRQTGTDFCDTCTELKNHIYLLESGEKRETLIEARRMHREKASQEYKVYLELSDKGRSTPAQSDVHVTFDFAEKVLLPSLKRQPGQLHFVTGLKFDIFGAASSNLDKVFVYGLPEGYWPNSKTANEVLSMVEPIIIKHVDTR